MVSPPNARQGCDDPEPPAYEAAEGSSRSRPRDDSNDQYSTARDREGGVPRDRRAAYTRQLQRACKTALQRVKQDNALASSTWAEPLAAAPAAISVMAFLLKTAADKKVAGLTVSDLTVKDEKGDEVGKLPSKYFHTNLQHCSDIGRLAFLDAQKRMNKINSVARSMMEEGGSVTYIVQLLEDPEDAKHNLKPELEEVKKTATDCRKECEDMKKKFEYWQAVILHLGQTTLDLRSEKIEMVKTVGEKKAAVAGDVVRHRDEAAAAKSKIKNMQRNLDRAIDRVSRAQDELDKILALPPVYEPSHYEELREAQSLAPMTHAPEIDRGWISNTAKSILGWNAKKHREEDVAYADAHRAKQEGRQNRIIMEERARRGAARKRAEEKLEEAREREAEIHAEIEAAVKDLSLNEDKLAEAKANLAKATSDLERLGNQELELTDIVQILRESTSSLGELKRQLEPLILFFSGLETTIDVDVMKQVDAFVKTINRNIETSDTNPNEVASIRHLRGASKQRVFDAALQIQGRFSVIADISSAYVQISNRCIREAINRMEILSKVSDDDWEIKRLEFGQWCQEAIDEIDNISRVTSEQMGETMKKRIGMVERCAIEAADEAEE